MGENPVWERVLPASKLPSSEWGFFLRGSPLWISLKTHVQYCRPHCVHTMVLSFSHTVNSSQATFLGFALEAIAYGLFVSLHWGCGNHYNPLLGVYAILFFACIAVLIGRTPAVNTSKTPMFAITCFMFSLCTVHFSLNFHNIYDSLVRYNTISKCGSDYHRWCIHTQTSQPRHPFWLVGLRFASWSQSHYNFGGADLVFSITDFFSQLILMSLLWVIGCKYNLTTIDSSMLSSLGPNNLGYNPTGAHGLGRIG